MPYPQFDSLQTLFDFVTSKVIEQGERSVDAKNACQYRSVKDGKVLKCAVGHLIPDDIYALEMEGRTVLGLHADFELPYTSEEISLLRSLQFAHDQADESAAETFVEDFKYHACNTADDFDLIANF